MSKILSEREERFCIDYVKHNNASKAYRDNFSCEGVYHKNITRRANYLVTKKHILKRVIELSS